jgi:hypothetical protein
VLAHAQRAESHTDSRLRLYRIETGLEFRCGFGEDDLLRSQTASEIGTARNIAEQWRQAVIAKGGFEDA